MHRVGLGDLEGQKRTASFTCSLMGIIPVSSIHLSLGGGNGSLEIPSDWNLMSTVEMETCDEADDPLILNQAKTFQLKIGMLNSKTTGFNKKVRELYSLFSTKKADAAAKAQERTWKDIALALCRDVNVRGHAFPCDFSKEFYDKEEDREVGKPPKQRLVESESGNLLHKWLLSLRKSVLARLHKEVEGRTMFKVLPVDADTSTLEAFIRTVNKSIKKTTGSIYSFPRKIPLPKAIHTMVYFISLTGPAASNASGVNMGLDNLANVISSLGNGILKAECECYQRNEIGYSQSVSLIED